MKNFKFVLLMSVVLGLILSSCSNVADPNLVICPVNPSGLSAEKQKCRENTKEILVQNVEYRTTAVNVPPQSAAIYYGYVEDFKPVVIKQVGPGEYPNDKSITLPLQVMDFRNDKDPSGTFCAGQAPRCIDVIGNVTVQYQGQDGQIRTVTDLTISVNGSLRFLVNDETAPLWVSLERARVWEDFWFKFWDQVRIPKVVSIVGSGVDPIADQWGEKTLLALGAAYKARLEDWKYYPLFELTDGVIVVKSVDLPAVSAVTGGITDNTDLVATQNAANLAQAQAFATQKAVICTDMDDLACSLLMQTYAGQNQSPVTIQAQATAVPAAP